MQVQKAYKIRFSKFSVDLLTWNRIRIQTKSKSHIIINLLMQIFHLNLFFAGQDFSTPYMADDLDLSLQFCLIFFAILSIFQTVNGI